MPIFRIEENETVLSIAAIFPPEKVYRNMPDKKPDNEKTFHITIVNHKDDEELERSAYIEMDKLQLKRIASFIEDYLRTGITKEI